jgi:hypothetical protein
MAFAAIAGPVIGGLLGSQEETKQGPQLDPRLAKYIYGDAGNSGLVNDAAKIYKQQMQQGGLNDLQRSGLEWTRQNVTNPNLNSSMDGFQDMVMQILNKGLPTSGVKVSSPLKFQPNTRPSATTAQPGSAISAAFQPITATQQLSNPLEGVTEETLQQMIDRLVNERIKRPSNGEDFA